MGSEAKPTCSSDGCELVVYCKGECQRHYQRRLETPVYRAWRTMRYRCNNPNDKAYPDYGGRGIKVCDRWNQSFANFASDMGEKPAPEYSLDRIDNNGNYEPSNCRWATKQQQVENRRRIRPWSEHSTGYNGVRRMPDGRWRAVISIKGRPIELGVFTSFEEAVKTRKAAEDKLWEPGTYKPRQGKEQL